MLHPTYALRLNTKYVISMTEQRLYDRAIGILDNFYSESIEILKDISDQNTWKENAILTLFRQASHILFALLSNTEKSKYLNSTYVTELIYIGSLGRIIRDIYVKIIYLKTDRFPDEIMKLCWDYQVLCQKINATKFELTEEFKDEIAGLKKEKDNIKDQLENYEFSTKGQVLQGREEKLLSLQEIANFKGFDKERFENEFVFFSQFSHSTAFANNFITKQGVPFSLIAATYHKIVAYYVGVVTESIALFLPNHEHIEILKEQYNKIIKIQWTNNTST